MLVFVCAFIAWYAFTYHWEYSVQTIKIFTKKKYRYSNREVRTTTPSYSLGSNDQEKEATLQVNTKTKYTYTPNSNYFWKPKKLEYDTPEKTYPLDEALSCVPQTFGYTKEKGQEVFPKVNYPSCASQVEDASQTVHLDYEKNLLTMNCKGKYLLGPVIDSKLTLRFEVEDKWEVNEYPGVPVPISSTHDFALATCEGDLMDRAFYAPRFNQTLYNATLNRVKQLQQETQTARKPLVILMLVTDSFSRKHFYRMLSETTEYLNELQNSEYSVHDFLIHNIIGTNSVGNQAPILGSKF